MNVEVCKNHLRNNVQNYCNIRRKFRKSNDDFSAEL